MEAGSAFASETRDEPVLRFARWVAACALLDLTVRRGLARAATAIFDPRASLYAETAGRLVANVLGLVTLVALVSLVRAVFRTPELRLGPLRRMVVGALTVIVIGTFGAALVLREQRFHALPMLTLMAAGYADVFALSCTFAVRGVRLGHRLACVILGAFALLGAVSSVSGLVLGMMFAQLPAHLARPLETALEVAYFSVPVGAVVATASLRHIGRRLLAAGAAFVAVFALGTALATTAPEAYAAIVYGALRSGGVANLPPTFANALVALAFGAAAFAATGERNGRAVGVGSLGVLAAGVAPTSPLCIAVLVASAATIGAEPDATPEA